MVFFIFLVVLCVILAPSNTNETHFHVERKKAYAVNFTFKYCERHGIVDFSAVSRETIVKDRFKPTSQSSRFSIHEVTLVPELPKILYFQEALSSVCARNDE